MLLTLGYHSSMMTMIEVITYPISNILEPEILGNHNINTGKILLLKTIVN